MKIIQIISHETYLYALTDTGVIYTQTNHRDDSKWTEVNLPEGCEPEPR